MKKNIILILLLSYSSLFAQTQAELRLQKPTSLTVGTLLPYGMTNISLEYSLNKWLSIGGGFAQGRVTFKHQNIIPLYSVTILNKVEQNYTDQRGYVSLKLYPLPAIPFYFGAMGGHFNGSTSEIQSLVFSNLDRTSSNYAYITSTLNAKPNSFVGLSFGFKYQFESGFFMGAEAMKFSDKISQTTNITYKSYGYGGNISNELSDAIFTREVLKLARYESGWTSSLAVFSIYFGISI